MRLKLLCIFGLVSCTAFAQQGTADRGEKIFIYASAGSGIAFSDNLDQQFTGRLALNFSYRQKYFTTFLFQENAALDGFPFGTPVPPRLVSLKNGSLLFSKGRYIRRSLAVIPSAGISYGRGEYRGNLLYLLQGWNLTPEVFETDVFYYFGLPLNLKLLWTSPVGGLSLDLYCNLHKHADYGILLSFNLGKIRTAKPL